MPTSVAVYIIVASVRVRFPHLFGSSFNPFSSHPCQVILAGNLAPRLPSGQLVADCVAEVCGYRSEAAASISRDGSHHPLFAER
jgi:hypothetical protein